MSSFDFAWDVFFTILLRIGIAVAYEFYEVAVLLSLITFLTLALLTPAAAEKANPDEGNK